MASPSAEGDNSNSNSKVNLLDLSASCLSSAIVAADQITSLASTTASDGDTVGDDKGEIQENKKNARLKIDGSFVTDADMAAQQIIVDALHKVSSGIRIVGEENEEEMRSRAITGHEKRLDAISQLAREEIFIRYHGSVGGDGNRLPLAQGLKCNDESTNLEEHENGNQSSLADGIKESIASRIGEIEEIEIDTDRVSIFIDPLDATNSYAKGDHDPVSILVAIILDQAPCFGVICKPFGYPERTSVLDTGCVAVYGGTLLGGAYIAGGCEITKSAEESQDLPRAVISKSRNQGIVQNFVTHLGEKGIIHPEPLLVSGAGEKSLRIVAGYRNEGLWFFPKGGTSLWDVAASDALLRAIGGKLTDKYGNDMDYSKSRKEAENMNGVVASCDQRLHADCIRLFLEGSWEDA